VKKENDFKKAIEDHMPLLKAEYRKKSFIQVEGEVKKKHQKLITRGEVNNGGKGQKE